MIGGFDMGLKARRAGFNGNGFLWNEYEFYENETNKEVYGEDELYDLGMEEAYVENEFFDSRNKGEDASIQVGVPNEEWTKTGGFQPLAYGENEY